MKSPSLQQQDEEFREALRVIPVRNRHVRAEPAPDDPDCLVVEVELRYRTRLQRLLRDALRASSVRRVRLDRLGTAVYRMIDDRKTYAQLAEEVGLNAKSSDRTIRKWCDGGILENIVHGRYKKIINP